MDDEETTIGPQAFVAQVTQAGNVLDLIDGDMAARIGLRCLEDHQTDKESMQDWLDKMQRGIDLANMVKTDRNYPFKNSSNVKYPLIASAAMQFNARAYPAIVQPEAVVRCRVQGRDPTGAKAARGARVAEHMNSQITNEITEWEEETDKLLIMLPVVGTLVRKVWYDSAKGRRCVKLVEPGKFIVHDKVRSLPDAPRCGEIIELYPVEVKERIRAGVFVDFDMELEEDREQRLQEFVEQHTRIDLDGDDYPEPYIVTIHLRTQKVVRIVADFEPEDVSFTYSQEMQEAIDPMTGTVVVRPVEVATGIQRIQRGTYYAPYHFVPSMSGGFWGTGLGILLGDLAKSIDSVFNMLLDAGHMASLGGGFIGGQLRLKGGNQRFQPGEWKQIPNSGSDIKNSLVPLTFPGPDQTLFAMLGMMIEAGREIASVKDVITGDSGQRVQTATATIALIEQGLAVFTAVYKRVFRALRAEFRLLARINQQTVSPEEYQAFLDEEADPRADYDLSDMDIVPVADPQSVTRMQSMATAQFLMEMAQQGLVDAQAAAHRILEAASIPDVEDILPKPNPMQEAQGELMMRAAEADVAQKMADIELTLMKIEAEKANITKTLSETEAIAAKTRLDALAKQLEAAKIALEQSVRRRPERVEGTPGYAAPQGGSASGAGVQQAFGLGGVLAGGALAG